MRAFPTRSSTCFAPSMALLKLATFRRRQRSRHLPTATARSCCVKRFSKAIENAVGFRQGNDFFDFQNLIFLKHSDFVFCHLTSLRTNHETRFCQCHSSRPV